MAVFMCIHLHYRTHKQRVTSFELFSILWTEDLSKHLIAAWIFRKFIQPDNFVTFSVLFFFFGNRVRLTLYERVLSCFREMKSSCKNLFNTEHFCNKILSAQIKIQRITNLTRCNRPWNGLKRQMLKTRGGGLLRHMQRLIKCSSPRVQIKDSGFTWGVDDETSPF